MGKEYPSTYYTGKGYLQPGKFEVYKPLYNEIVKLLPSPSKCRQIIDLGCGVGYFAKILTDVGFKMYIGVDFSEKVLDYARKHAPSYDFRCIDLYDEKIKTMFLSNKIFVMIETLEHIKDDMKVLNYLPSNATIIGSVPSALSETHVRAFKGISDVVQRYNKIIDFDFMKTIVMKPKNHKVTIFRGRIL
jgi:trans-aconitate methyltransferase